MPSTTRVATSISPWIVPLEALQAARIAVPAQSPEPLPHLRDVEDWGLDVELEVELNGETVSRPPYAPMYWSPAQMLAHMTSNGARLRTGDLFASGTVSSAGQPGSLIELTDNARAPITLADGSTRGFLADGDTVTITASGLGDVVGRIQGRVR